MNLEHTTVRSSGKSRHRLVEGAESSSNTIHIVFSSHASYHPLVWLLVAFAPLSTLLSLWFVLHDSSSSDEERERAIRGVSWCLVALVIVFSLVLPRRFEVISNSCIRVVTWIGIKWTFGHVTEAHDNQSIFAEWLRPKLKFAVDLHKRVVVRRADGRWDILVSPRDPQGFVDAVQRVAAGDDEAAQIVPEVT